MLGLAACGGAPTAAPTLLPSQSEPTPTPESLQAAAQSSTSSSAATNGASFQVEISGDFSLTLAPPDNTIRLFYSTAGASAYFLQFGDEFGLPILYFTFGIGDTPKAGMYTLVSPPSGSVPDSGSVTVSANLLSDEEDANGMKLSYAFDQPQGTLTLEQNGDSYSGSFDFTLRGKAFASNDYTRTITVKGSFSGVSPDTTP